LWKIFSEKLGSPASPTIWFSIFDKNFRIGHFPENMFAAVALKTVLVPRFA